MRRRLPACLLLAVALTGVSGSAAADDKPVKRPPTTLWNAFPLREKPEPQAGVAAATATSLAPVPRPSTMPLAGVTAESDPNERLTTVLMLLELTLMLGAIGLAIVLFGPDLNPLALAHARPHFPRARDASGNTLAARPQGRRRRPARARREQPVAHARVPTAPTESDEMQPLMPRLPVRERTARPSPVPAVLSADERCSVYWRAGYVTAQFVAKTSPEAGATVAVSPAFRWHHKDSPPTESDASAHALAVVVDQLEREGWVTAAPNGREWFALTFARPRAAADACRIEWAHAYVTGCFRAVVSKADGSRTVIAESSDLRSVRGHPPADSEQAHAALDALVAKLARVGWAPEGRGEQWFSLSLRRTRSSAL
jgi:hypothetical protein